MTTPIERYLGRLDEGDFEAAAALFADGALYLRPGLTPRGPGEPGGVAGLVLLRGRPAILDYFQARGRQPHRHVILNSATNGRHCFVEMTLAGFGAHFESLAVAELDESGLILRYVALGSPVEVEVAGMLFQADVSS
jgi:hypothetical protein